MDHGRCASVGWIGGVSASLMGACLLALVFLGSPGCGCSDDLPDPVPQPDPCCCTFEWIMYDTGFPGADIDIVFTNVDASLQPYAIPATLVNVQNSQVQMFQICVLENHALGAQMDVEFRDAAAPANLLASAQLTYDVNCEPQVELLTGIHQLLRVDCGP